MSNNNNDTYDPTQGNFIQQAENRLQGVASVVLPIGGSNNGSNLTKALSAIKYGSITTLVLFIILFIWFIIYPN